MTSLTAAEVFDLNAEKYDRWFDSPEGSALFRSELEAVQLLAKNMERPFLEIGVGSGRFAEELGIEFGIDPSPGLLKMAMKRGINVTKAYGENLPFKDNSFGAVFILFTLCFVKNPQKVIEETHRVLKHGGCLIMGIINRESPWGDLYMKKREDGHPIYRHARFFNAKEVSGMLKAAGFEINAYSSTLCQAPSDIHYEEAQNRLVENAGFICVRAMRRSREAQNDYS